MKTSHIDMRAVVALANSLGYQPSLAAPSRASEALPGQIYALGNDDSRFTEAMFSEPLTTYAVGYKPTA